MKLIRVGVDLAKNVFQVHGVDRNEKAVWRRKLMRENWLKVLLETVESGCEIGMESCGGAHYWARRLQARGFKVRTFADFAKRLRTVTRRPITESPRPPAPAPRRGS